MNITQPVSDERHLVREISALECVIIDAICSDDKWLSASQEATLRWALSMARVSSIATSGGSSDIHIGHATDRYRESLFNTLKGFVRVDGEVNKKEIVRFIEPIGKLCADERKDLLQLYGNQLSPEMFDAAVRSRPLALALGGGGGTSFVYLGAFELLEQAGIKPSAIAGASMGALLGAWRACGDHFSLSELQELLRPLSFDNVARAFGVNGDLSAPGTFKLHLREVFGKHFERDGREMALRDLRIPFRAVIAGLAHIEGEKDDTLEEYAHLLDQRAKGVSIMAKLIELSRKPLKGIYVGGDEISNEMNVIDALGFSCSVPGVFNYDLKAGDARALEVVQMLMKRHGVYKLVDGGWVDNLPSHAAMSAAQSAPGGGRDPFVLALDGFAPNLYRHWLYLPLMQVAAQTSRPGRELAHRTISYKHVLSPMNVIPKARELQRAIDQGIAETKPHMPFIKKMVGPIEDPNFLRI